MTVSSQSGRYLKENPELKMNGARWEDKLESKRRVDFKEPSHGLDVCNAAQCNYNVNSRALVFRDMRCRHRGIFECPVFIDSNMDSQTVQSLGERHLKHGA